MMRIGIYVAHAGVVPGFENMASGHLQVPMQTAKLLGSAGHQVCLVTTQILDGRVMPSCFPEGLRIFQVTDASLQGNRLISERGRQTGIKPGRLLRLLLELQRVAVGERLDVLHFFGGAGAMHLAALFKLVASPCRVVGTMNVGLVPAGRFVPALWRRLDALVTSTAYHRDQLQRRQIMAEVVRHGIVRDIEKELVGVGEKSRNRVLFWREATWRNGGDIAVEVIRRLAPRHPETRFSFALRPHWKQAEGLANLVNEHANVDLYQAPYPSGVSLAMLLAESICVLQPFREYTIQPQLSILESMYAGVPVVACDVQSTGELIQHGRNGIVAAPENVDELVQGVESLLNAPDLARQMGEVAASDAAEQWNWDSYVAMLERSYDSMVISRKLQV